MVILAAYCSASWGGSIADWAGTRDRCARCMREYGSEYALVALRLRGGGGAGGAPPHLPTHNAKHVKRANTAAVLRRVLMRLKGGGMIKKLMKGLAMNRDEKRYFDMAKNGELHRFVLRILFCSGGLTDISAIVSVP